MEKGQCFQVILCVYNIYAVFCYGDKPFQKDRRHESPLADYRRIVIYIEYIQYLICRLVIPVLGGMVIIKNQSVPVV